MSHSTEQLSIQSGDIKNDSDSNISFTKSRTIKNLLVLSFSYLIFFCATDGLTVLQSTLNKDVGTICLAIQYVFGFLAALLLPKYLIKNFGSKMVIFASMLSYVPYVASNFYPYFSLMIPCSLLVGCGTSLIWAAVCTYLNDLSVLYSKISNDIEKKLANCNSFGEVKKFKAKTRGSVRKHKDSIFITKQSLFTEESLTESLKNKLKKNGMLIKAEQETDHDNSEKNVNGPTKCDLKEQQSNKRMEDEDESNLKRKGGSLKNNNIQPLANDYPSESLMNKEKEHKEISSSVRSNSISCDIDLKKQNTSNSNCIALKNEEDLLSHHKAYSDSNSYSKSLESTTALFFGVFGGIYQVSHVLNHMISYSILENSTKDLNFSRNHSCMCGSQFCDINSQCFEHNLQLPNKETRYILISIYLVMSLAAAFFLFLCLDSVSLVKNKVTFSLEIALATLKHQKNINQVLLIALSFYIGMHQAFATGDYNKDYVGCAWGVNNVTLVGIAGGAALSLSSCAYGVLEKYFGRRLLFLVAMVVNVATYITMLTWVPNSEKPAMFFVVVVLMQGCSGITWCHLRTFIGILFKEDEEAAFGSYQLWHAMGMVVGFAYSNYICDYLKIYFLLTVQIVGTLGYLISERNYSLKKSQQA